MLWILRGDLLKEQRQDGRPDLWRFKEFKEGLESFTWPSHIGRIENRIVDMVLNSRSSKSGSLSNVKADEWVRIRIALPVVLWRALREHPDSDDVDVSSDRLRIYLAVVRFCAALNNLMARSISLNEADRHQTALSEATEVFRQSGLPMTINWHLAQHLSFYIARYGPVSTWSSWAFERNNGVLARINLFKGDFKRMPPTLMGMWYREAMVRTVLQNPAPTASDIERASLETFKRMLEPKKTQGTFLMEVHRARAANRFLKLPTLQPAWFKTNLRKVPGLGSLYTVMFDYVQNMCPQIDLVDENDHRHGVRLPAHGHVTLPYIEFNGFKFQGEGSQDRFSMVHGASGDVSVCRIEGLFQLQLPEDFSDCLTSVQRTVAAVRYLESSDAYFSWYPHAIDLSMRVVHHVDEESPIEVVPAASLKSSVALAEVDMDAGPVVVVIDLDKVRHIIHLKRLDCICLH